MIKTCIDNSKKLTTHILTGKITSEDILAEIKKFYDVGPTDHNLWDLIEADVSAIKWEDIKKLSKFPLEYAPVREEVGRTAIVCADDLAFGLSRVYQNLAEAEGQKVQIKVFRSLKDALSWVDS